MAIPVVWRCAGCGEHYEGTSEDDAPHFCGACVDAAMDENEEWGLGGGYAADHAEDDR